MAGLLLRPEQAFSELGVSRSKGYAMISRGELPIIRLGRSVRIPARELEAWIARHIEGGTTTEEASSRG